MAFKAHTTFRPVAIPEVTTLVDEVYEDKEGNEVIRKVRKNVNELAPVVDASTNQLINQINAGVPIRKVSTLIDINDRFDAETELQKVSRETPDLTSNED